MHEFGMNACIWDECLYGSEMNLRMWDEWMKIDGRMNGWTVV